MQTSFVLYCGASAERFFFKAKTDFDFCGASKTSIKMEVWRKTKKVKFAQASVRMAEIGKKTLYVVPGLEPKKLSF
jgi:hypothetical protein